MTSLERREARYQRRVENRTAKAQDKLSQYDSFDLIADVDNLYAAFQKSKKGVAWKESVQRYEANALRNILDTSQRLLAGKNIQHGFVEFYLHERGKIRHIKSIHISERVVQKCLCDQVLVPILSNGLIYDNGASMKGKGVHFSIRRFITHLSKFYRSNGYSNAGYCLSIDFSKYFDSIDHELLLKMLEKEITDERVLELTKNFISVFGDGKSLGLGSQVSQISAIYFPNLLDHFIKEVLRIKYYGRYMDDLYLIHESKEYLKHCLNEIIKICDQLKININMKKTCIEKLDHGIEFLKGKYKLLHNGKVLRLPGKASTKRMRRKLVKFKNFIDNGTMGFNDLRTAYQSWRGNYRRRFQAYHRIRYMDKLYNDLFIKIH
jgi:retron-type reverse transcriptase